MKYTLLELTQAVLSSMDSDEVNSISDTVESQQVVTIIKTVHDDIISRGDLVSNKTLFNLDASIDPLKPVLMTKPDNIDRIEWLKYDTAVAADTIPAWGDMTYLPIVDFVDYVHSYNPTESNVDTFDYVADGFVFRFTYRNDTAPHYFTTFDDNTIIFDAYDVAVDSTLQSVKTLGYGHKKTTFVASDTWVPNLQPEQFSLLLNEAKSLAWAELKQTTHGKAEVSARRNWRHLQKTRQNSPDGTTLTSNAHYFNKIPSFARNGR